MLNLSICMVWFVNLFILSLLCFMFGIYFIYYDYVIFIEYELFFFNSMSIVMTLLFDWMSLLFMSFILFISCLVIFYSMEYMIGDLNINRFILLMLMFVFSMMLLVISPNLISILLGWDGLGLISYCLVIYFQNIKSLNAGMLTVLSNRVGDVMLLLAISWMLNFGSWNYIFYLEVMKECCEMKLISLMIILASLTKSAQIPFSSWLPAAMAAPTPVSALVHSSTLVTAGIYLLIRFSFVLEEWSSVLLIISSLTMFMAGLCANFEFDLKKIIALSTLSQLGLMMSILSLGFYKLAYFHMLTHAVFKALLFLCAGSIIHNMSNCQDIRMMGSLSLMMPITSSCFNVANLSLCGMPFLSGFYSKDMILEMVMMSYVNLFIMFLFVFSTGLTVCYSFRLVFYTMLGNYNFFSLNLLNDEGWVMLKSMLTLMLFSIFSGSMLSWLLFSKINIIILPFYLKMLVLFICFMGMIFGLLLSNISLYKKSITLKFYSLSFFFSSMWFLPYISTYGIMYFPLMIGKLVYKSFDHGWSEYFGASYMYMYMMNLSKINQIFQNNSLKLFMLSFMVWIIMLSLFMFL
uniref:NADH-ubiquinone oxidoreductase chain 5 n=1 Tax=Melophagus ovinus TaxID=452749 RepID=A0A343DCD8_9MUSC|nr:NADH dehydrogenase subunit 5 [Melophagus ovinus]ART65749.1 NADH dehydrogenase subunit 5 [Melophagus ovinus]